MVSPVTTQVISKSSGLFGKMFGFLFKYKLAFLLVIFVSFQIISTGVETGDWNNAIIEAGKEFINPLQDANDRLDALNSGVTGLFDSIIKYLALYLAFYKMWLWFKLVFLLVNFLMKDANSPMIRVIVSLFIFLPLFYFITGFYSASVLGESILYPFALTKEIYIGLLQLISNFPFSVKFDIFGEAVNTCTNTTCLA